MRLGVTYRQLYYFRREKSLCPSQESNQPFTTHYADYVLLSAHLFIHLVHKFRQTFLLSLPYEYNKIFKHADEQMGTE
jgi:hypothetical protein